MDYVKAFLTNRFLIYRKTLWATFCAASDKYKVTDEVDDGKLVTWCRFQIRKAEAAKKEGRDIAALVQQILAMFPEYIGFSIAIEALETGINPDKDYDRAFDIERLKKHAAYVNLLRDGSPGTAGAGKQKQKLRSDSENSENRADPGEAGEEKQQEKSD